MIRRLLPLLAWVGMALGAGAHAAETLAIRGTLPWHNFLCGPTAWDEADYVRYLDRMKDQGLNYVAFHCYTGGAERYAPYVEPMIRLQYRDVLAAAGLDTSTTARWGYRPLRLADFAFGTERFFPHVRGADAFGAKCATTARNQEERYSRAQSLMRRVMHLAHERGIQFAMGFEFGIHPPEFASIVPPDSVIRGANLPDPTHPANLAILRGAIDDLLRAYPQIDWIWLWLHEHTMYVGQAQPGARFQQLLAETGGAFGEAANEADRFTGVWSLAYIRAANDYLQQRYPKVRLAISGWGGGTQLPGTLRGLDRLLPTHIVFTCLNSGQGSAAAPAALLEIAAHRPVWAIPWLEGDGQMWHPQPRVGLLRDQVLSAAQHGLPGVLAIHWRTEEIDENFQAYATFTRDPAHAPSVETYYRQYAESRYGPAAAEPLTPILVRQDRQGGLHTSSPEYFPYDPTWGRLSADTRRQLEADVAAVHAAMELSMTGRERRNLERLSSEWEFDLLLDEVGRRLEPAWRLQEDSLRKDAPVVAADTRRLAWAALKAAPMEKLFHAASRKVRDRDSLGVLSSLNQRVWLQYRELEQFVGALKE